VNIEASHYFEIDSLKLDQLSNGLSALGWEVHFHEDDDEIGLTAPRMYRWYLHIDKQNQICVAHARWPLNEEKPVDQIIEVVNGINEGAWQNSTCYVSYGESSTRYLLTTSTMPVSVAVSALDIDSQIRTADSEIESLLSRIEHSIFKSD
jgi:hypothetical protein